ncbi:MAG: hypothetical protein QXO98_02060 [Sulfolobales archaeon]
MNISRGSISLIKKLPLLMGLLIFYIYGVLWTLKPRKIVDMNDLLSQFYYGFLRLKKEDVEIVKLTNKELITISKNPCPILKLTLLLGMDTRYTCRFISETVCRYVLKRINPELTFERNYSYIRPYKDGCMERIYLKDDLA